jgi:hypothetical protein
MCPALLGVAPFGLICGVSAVEVCLSPAQAMGLSLFIFAGTAQLAAIELVGQGAGAAVVIQDGQFVGPLDERLAAAVVAWITENILATIAAGMAFFWVLGLF